jgi:hypothetical protein
VREQSYFEEDQEILSVTRDQILNEKNIEGESEGNGGKRANDSPMNFIE